ncbi:MAG: translocation and assembly module TamB, partial [Gammaproteobacteria bacterium]|nr:translocation and assembly module TamB [Gammaproteobacteria bacterium]
MRRAVKITAWMLGGLVLLVVALGGGVMVAGNTDPGRAWIERLTYRLTGGYVKLTGLGGSFPTRLTLRELQIIDHSGVWLTADAVSLTWSPLRLLERRIQIDTLQAARVDVERAPVSDGHGGKASVPYIDVAQFSIATVEVGAPLVGTATTLSLQGGLRLRSLEDASGDVVAHRLNGEGDYTLHLRFDPKRMDASLAIHEPAGGPLENLLSLPGLGALTATATLQGPRNAELLDVVLGAGDLQARIKGSIDLAHQAADLDYSLNAPAMAPRPDVAWGGISLTGTWHGSLAAPTAAGRLDVGNLRIAGSTRIAKLAASLTASGGKLGINGVVSGLEIPGPQPRFLAKDPLNIDASLQLGNASRPLQVTARHPLFSLQGRMETAPQKTGELSGAVELRLPDLVPFAVFTGQDVRGSAVINGRLVHAHASDALSLEATLGLTGGTARWLDFAGPRIAVQLSGSLAGPSITVDNLRIAGRVATLAASGSAERAAAATATSATAAAASSRAKSN